MTKQADEIAALTAKVNALERQLSGTDGPTEEDVARHRDKVHQMNEARMSTFNPFTRSQMAAFRDAAPGGIWRDHHCAPTGPSQAGASGQVTKTSSNPGLPGSNIGWQAPIPIRPPPGINYVDAQLDAQDARDRAELVRQHEAMQRALGKMK